MLHYPVSSHSWDATLNHFELFFHVNGELPASGRAGPDFTKVFISELHYEKFLMGFLVGNAALVTGLLAGVIVFPQRVVC